MTNKLPHVLPPAEPAPRPATRATAADNNYTAGRFAVLNTFVDDSMRYLRPADKAIWFVLWRDTKNGIAYTAQSYIAERAGVSEETVKKALGRNGRLRKLGLVVKVGDGGHENGGFNSYRVCGKIKTSRRGTGIPPTHK